MSEARPSGRAGCDEALPDGRASDTAMIEIINRQRTRKINAKSTREFAARALQAIGKQSDVTIVFVSDGAIRKLNKQFRGKNYATDVLSFPVMPSRLKMRINRTSAN